MYAAPSVCCRKGNIIQGGAGKDKENKGVKVTDNTKERGEKR